jgi:hypothetical protein
MGTDRTGSFVDTGSPDHVAPEIGGVPIPAGDNKSVADREPLFAGGGGRPLACSRRASGFAGKAAGRSSSDCSPRIAHTASMGDVRDDVRESH